MDNHDAQLWMQQHTKGYLKKGNFLYRGIAGAIKESGLLFADSRQGVARKSISGMANYYTLWMSHHPDWKDLPRRERSFIVTHSENQAAEWGKPHIVIPADDSKIGSVGESDIWMTRVGPDRFSLSNFTNSTEAAILEVGDSRGDDFQRVETFADLVKNLKNVTLKDLEDVQADDPHSIDPRIISMMQAKGSITLYDLWESTITPKLFKFMNATSISGRGEFWIEGPALFIPLSPGANLNSEEQYDLIMWAEDYAPNLADELKKHWKSEGEDRIDPDTVSARDTLTYSKKKQR